MTGPTSFREPGTYDFGDVLTVEADGGVRTVTINRPDDLNAVNRELHWALAHVWRQIAADVEAKVVVVTGAGRAFSAGGDLEWIASFEHDHVARDDSIREGAEIIDEMLRFPLPVVAAVNGPAVGLGCSVAILSDICLVSDRATFADPHVSVGLVAGDGGAAFWPLLTPIMRSREFLFTGDTIDADTAVELGLATRVVAHDDLLGEARRVADRLARQPAVALRGTKQVVNMYLAQAMGAVSAGFAAEQRSMESDDHRRRIAKLRERAGS